MCGSSQAHRIVYNFGIQHEFPDIEQLYSRDALLKLIDKQKWTIALSYVGSDATLQSVLLAHLLASREWRLATSLARDRMGMDDFDAEKEAARVVDNQTNKDHSSSLSSLPINGYLELPLKDVGDIVFCETEESIRLAAAHVFNGTPLLVGLDVEWRPTSTKIASHTGVLTTTAVASILQIASGTKVFLIDLLALHVRWTARLWHEVTYMRVMLTDWILMVPRIMTICLTTFCCGSSPRARSSNLALALTRI
jgi:hypothetical protein